MKVIFYLVGIGSLIYGIYGFTESRYVTHQGVSILIAIFGLGAIGIGALLGRRHPTTGETTTKPQQPKAETLGERQHRLRQELEEISEQLGSDEEGVNRKQV